MTSRRTLPKGFDFARWQVERERCQIQDARPRPPFKEATKVADVLDGALRKFGIIYSADEDRIQKEWVEIVGRDLARHAAPGSLTKGVLVVYVSGAVWLAELRRAGAKKLVEKINAHCGEGSVRDIAFRAAPTGYRH